MLSPSPYKKKNVLLKLVITIFVTFGVFCAVYSSLSCRWFVFTPADIVRNDWSFLPLNDTKVASIGLFRYQVGENDVSFDDRHGQCVQYNPIFLGNDYKWLFMAQVCLVLGPIMACVAWLFAMIGVHKNPTAFFLLMATGVQASAVVASMSWCDEFFNCPWLLGSLANAVAAFLFLLSWILAMFGLEKEKDEEQQDDESEGSWHSNSANGDTKGSFQWGEEETVVFYGPDSGTISVPEPEPAQPARKPSQVVNDPILRNSIINLALMKKEMNERIRSMNVQRIQETEEENIDDDNNGDAEGSHPKEKSARLETIQDDEMDAAEKGFADDACSLVSVELDA